MSIEEFKNKYLGKQVEYHSYGTGAYNQCVDLVNQYINEVLDNNTKDYTEIIGTNAKDFNNKYDPEDFDFIANTPTGVPQRGDIMVWNGRVGGGAGHVAIYFEGDVKSFKSLDQNWSQVERVTLETHTYSNVSGWLRPKNYTENVETDPLAECLTQHTKLVTEAEEKDKTIAGLKGTVTKRDDEITRLNGEIAKFKESNKSLITEWQSKVDSANSRANQIQAELDLKKSEVESRDKMIEDLKGVGRTLTSDLEKEKTAHRLTKEKLAVYKSGALSNLSFFEKIKLLFNS